MPVDCVYFTPEVRCYRDGRIERQRFGCISSKWKNVKMTPDIYGYCHIGVGINEYKKILRNHRIIAFCFGKLAQMNAENDENDVDHIDGNKLNNHIDNLREVTDHENSFNKHTTKGYTFRKDIGKYQATIVLNKKHIHLGCFLTKEEARKAYLDAKAIYHQIRN